MTTRAEFLARIRSEVRKTSGRPSAATTARPVDRREAVEIVRRQLLERWPATLDRFQREFERVGGVLHRVSTVDEVPAIVGELARQRSVRRLVAWHPDAVGAALRPGLEAQSLTVVEAPADLVDDAERRSLRAITAEAEIGLTGADLAIADTGTLVLRAGPGRPRATSLLPATHVAVFAPRALIESLEQLGVFLEAWQVRADGGGGMINLITGPSRTADIELTLTRGVHGPKEVHAVCVESGLDG